MFEHLMSVIKRCVIRTHIMHVMIASEMHLGYDTKGVVLAASQIYKHALYECISHKIKMRLQNV